MFDRLVHLWMPLLFVVICGLILLPQTSAPVIRFVIDLMYSF